MSGGTWDHGQFKIQYIVDDLEKTEAIDLIRLTPHMRRSLLKTTAMLKECAVRMQRLDWYLAGDDGEETYRSRLKEELEKLK